ncbi:hypothetical protein FRZ03_09570 [Streptomyces misionensis]|uniref:Uncharacterized protein n=1 Tax=Streptomyces misionensis TaxID=67331 RepID=A0A5C6JXI0_9ACTN|nr:hypothetical protein [Streptomyces misionensis]TWV53588.1 hypothetical protein FRZ03_09570 [Streptomyces misionensis]
MDAMTAPAILADQLAERGLHVTNRGDHTVTVINPLRPHVGETVTDQGGRYITDYGYAIGVHGDEQATADRVAYLLGLPRPRLPRQPTHPEVAA